MFVVEVRIGTQWHQLREFKDQDLAVAIAKQWATVEKPYRVTDQMGMVVFQSRNRKSK